MEERAKSENHRHGLLCTELQEKAKDDPELARHLEATERAMERYS
jgi:hypothetical protein